MSSSAVLAKLLDILWERYKKRVPYAAKYQSMVEQRGGVIRNDHMAFRTFNCDVGEQPRGVTAIARIIEPLGYVQKDRYVFTDKKLTAWHWQHATDPSNPKIFISQQEVDQLSSATADAIKKSVAGARDLISSDDLKRLASGDSDQLAACLADFFARPWGPPMRSVVESVNKESQYAAWTLLHGNSVNHFTAYINEQRVKEWPDIEATTAALVAAGVPMKAEFEGERGTKLRQTSTKAASDDCDVVEENGSKGKMNWSYAYYELAERGDVPGPDGKPTRFQAFLGEQATNLFEMTKRD